MLSWLCGPTTFGVVFAAEKPEYQDGQLIKGDDPFIEATWKKANPGYGVSPTKRYMVEAAEKAKDSPAELARFLRLHLGIRTKQESRYLDVDGDGQPDLSSEYGFFGNSLGSIVSTGFVVIVSPLLAPPP
jgi:hypothetical protein